MTSASQYFDSLETRSPDERISQQLQKLPTQIQYAIEHSSAYAKQLSDIDSSQINSFEALASLPVTRKSELIKAQAAEKPFGGFAARHIQNVRRVFSSPGPIYEPEGLCDDYWRTARSLYAAGVRASDVIHNTYSYHLTPAGSMMESGADKIGATVIPAGTGQTELQVNVIADLQPNTYTGTPSFLKILIEKATDLNLPYNSIKKALVSGEALPPGLRTEFNNAGIFVLQAYATADLGLIAYESEAMEGMIIDEEIIVELLRPGTGNPVAPGEVGEVVVTTFNQSYPLIRFATGDLSVILPGISPCGRTNQRIKGWMGRADQTTKIKGMFVHPEQVNKVIQRHPEILNARMIVTNPESRDQFVLKCEVSNRIDGLIDAVTISMSDVIKLRGTVELCDPGSLENDGKVIDDARVYK